MTECLVDAYDAALFDLDGVIYLGPVAVEGAVGAMASLEAHGKRVMYVTNNAARSSQTVVDHLRQLGFTAAESTVLTSAQVAAVGIARVLPPGSAVLVAGSASLVDLIREVGLTPVSSADADPVAVVQGYDPQLTWPMLDEVCLAIQRGATWFATNDDASRPTDRGIVPGLGAMLAVVSTAIGGAPAAIFGKPFRPMLAEAVQRTGAQHPIFVGDRIDTDIIGANRAAMDSLLVFSGAHGKSDLLAAGPGERPTHIGADIAALLLPPRRPLPIATGVACGGQRVELHGREAVIVSQPITLQEQLDALWALAALAWGDPALETDGALADLDLLP
ncbi:MAG: HAD-IIA family hydrolase [Propionicimonas sp.]